MNDIETLADKAFDAEQSYKALGMQNTFNLDYEERRSQSIKYAKSQARFYEARANLDNAIYQSAIKKSCV